MAKHNQKKQIKHAQSEAQRRKNRAMLRHQTQLMNAQSDIATVVRAASGWPLHEVLLSQNWQQPGELVQALIARRSPGGRIVVAGFLIDLGCLGVKSAFANVFNSEIEYQDDLRDQMVQQQSMEAADLNLVAKIIREGNAYAKQLGFSPDPDYKHVVLILGTANADASDVPIPLGGEDGKPFFVAGPYDNAGPIIAQLTRKCGPDGFHFVAPLGNPDALLIDDEDGEEEDAEDNEEA